MSVLEDNRISIDVEDLKRLDVPIPRYTSYPTVPAWGPLTESNYRMHLKALGDSKDTISLYIHIPFCKTMCLFCGCTTVLNRRVDRVEEYLDYLIQEIQMAKETLGTKLRVSQLHFGGGTPTHLSTPQFERIFDALHEAFEVDYTGEISIEIDPRNVYADSALQLSELRDLGFNRVSFGVQDTNAEVQEVIKRRQSEEMSKRTLMWARDLGYRSINIDLMYGLPCQTRQTFSETVSKVLSWKPSRVAFFSYAKIPWLKPHQKAIKETLLPSTDEKFGIYVDSREAFLDAGYIQIGMDHFALPDDEMAIALENKELQRNFQGYSLRLSEHLLGLGMSSTSFFSGAYFQNQKELKDYYRSIDERTHPVFRGKVMSSEDKRRKWVIHTLMCDFSLDKEKYLELFGLNFDVEYHKELHELSKSELKKYISNEPSSLDVLSKGKLFIRNVVAPFDTYLRNRSNSQKFSKAI